MRNVMKYLGIMSVSLACAGPLFATSGYPFASVAVVQQSVATVKGQVVDEKGEPIIGANVIVEGTTNGMITDLDGNFSLAVSRRFYAEDQLHRLSSANGQSNREYECSENYFKGGYRNLG